MSNKSEASRQTTPTEDSLRLLIDTTPAFIHTALPDGALDSLNQGWLEFVGVPLTDLLGWRWTTAIHPEDVEEFVDKWRASVASGEPFVAESRVRRADGEYRWFLHRKVPLHDETGKIVKWYGSSLEIENRKWAEAELRRGEAYLSEAQRLSHTGSFGWDVLSGEIYWSDETIRIFGLEPKTKITTDLILQRTHPDDRQAVQQVIERASSERTEFALEHRLLMPDGSIKYLRVVGRPLQDEGRRSEFVGAVTDVTHHRQAEESLRKSEAYLADAQRLSHTGSWAWGPDTDNNYWSEECYRVLGFDPRNGVPGYDDFFRRVHPDDQPTLREQRDRILREKVDAELEYRIVHLDGSVRDIQSTCHPVLNPSGDLIELTGTVIDVTDRKRAEEELRRSEAFLAEAQRLSHTGSFGCKFSSGEMFWSEETFGIFGYNRATTPAVEAILQRVHPEDKARVQENMHRAASEGKGCDLEYRLLMPDDSVKHVHVVAHAANDEPGRFEFVGAVTDVTDRKRAEEALRASERKYRHLVDTTPAFIHTASPDGSLDFLSRGWLEYGGLALTDLKDWRWTEAIHPKDVEGFVDKWRAALATGETFEAESRLRRADGEYRWFLQRNVPLRDKTGEIVKWYGTGIEIEQRKQAEFYLAEGQRLAHMGSWAFNAAGFDYWSPELFRIHGLDPNSEAPTIEEYMGLVHPEDREFVAQTIEKTLADHRGFDFTKRIVRPDGEIRRVRCVGMAATHGGTFQGFFGTGMDVTEQEQLTEELRRSEYDLRERERELQQIVNLSPQHIGVFAPSGEPLYLNHAGLDYFGAADWGADDGGSEATHPWPGSRIDLVHPEDREHFVSERKKGFLGGRPFEHEARLRRHDGQFRCFLIRFAPLKDERGHITRWIGAGTDIEDRKRVEDEIKKENIVLREEIDKTSMFEEIVGVSASLQSVLTDVSKVAPTDSTVLITGETGTGKELVARAIHKRSQRSARAFVSVNCAAIPSSLIGSELFGHEKGAFTGATQRRQGRFELAEGGTIFLDEVGELPPEVQIALLRVLQEREFERVGSGRPIRADVRVIAATNRDLETAIGEKTFRSDLYYRLNVFPLEVPPLRERREDIPLLVEYFLHRFAKRAGKRINKISKETLKMFESYDWPGNVRELQNVVERAVIVSESDALDIDERWLLGGRTAAPFAAQPIQRMHRPRTQATQQEEKEAIETALMECKGRVSGPFGAASQLGLPSSTLESKIKALKIDKSHFRRQ